MCFGQPAAVATPCVLCNRVHALLYQHMNMFGTAAGWGPAGLDKQRRRHSGGIFHSAHRGTEHHGLQCAAVQLPPLLQPGLLPLHLLQGEHCHQHGHPFCQGECVRQLS